MKTVPLVLIAALPLVAAPRAGAPTFAVAEGRSLTKVFERNLEIVAETASIKVDGEEITNADPSSRQESSLRIELEDTYLAMGDGRPKALRRSYVALSSTQVEDDSDRDEFTEEERSSELEGATVLFTWDAEAEAYDTAFVNEAGDEEEGDESLLEDLEEDADLRGFLPEDEVAEGEEWELDGDAFRVLLAPAGDVRLENEAGEEGALLSLSRYLEGGGTATYDGEREIDGVDTAVIGIVAELRSSMDMAADDAEAGSATLSLELELEGKLLWNLQDGHFASLELAGPASFAVDGERTVEERQIEMYFLLKGTFSFTATQE